jgi:Protein of unknown function (DUF1569)
MDNSMLSSLMSAPIDTTTVTGRRSLVFRTIHDALADIDRLAHADRDGTLERLGNWTLGQAFGHLATWITFAYDGNPLRPPWIIRVFMKFKLSQFLKQLPPGQRIPGVKEGTLGTEILPTDVGLERLKAALARLQREAPTKPNPIFGPLTHEQWIALHLRHAELHLSYMKPKI